MLGIRERSIVTRAVVLTAYGDVDKLEMREMTDPPARRSEILLLARA